MKQRTITGLIILAIIIPIIYFGGIPFYLFIGVAMIIAMLEVFQATCREEETDGVKSCHLGCKSWPIAYRILIIVAVLISTFYPMIQNLFFEGKLAYPSYPNSFGDNAILYVPATMMFFIIFTLFSGAIFSEKFALSDIFYVGLMTIFLSLAGQATLICRETGKEYNVFIYIILICISTDTFAYFAGYLFGRHGKHKINPRISPKKTWEGAIGGTFFGTIISFIVGCFLPFEITGFNAWWSILLISFGLSIAAQFGDFTFSAIKRHFKIKDFGKIFPGHGGILDRLDSIFYNMIVMAIILTSINGIVAIFN